MKDHESEHWFRPFFRYVNPACFDHPLNTLVLAAAMNHSNGLHSLYTVTLPFSLGVENHNGPLGINLPFFYITLAKGRRAIISAWLVNVGWVLALFIFISAGSLLL
jgi:hypothetical protein